MTANVHLAPILATAAAMLLLALGSFAADNKPTALSSHAASSPSPSADPGTDFWKAAPKVMMESDQYGTPVPGHQSEIRSRWNEDYLYFLFICPYETLHLKPDPVVDRETNELWNWDVAEVFIGDDFANIAHYKEFEMSPHGEWVDLDIDGVPPKSDTAWLWNSGFTVSARIDAARKIWYGEMRIPFSAISRRPPAAGLEFRVNFYRAQGPPKTRLIAWQPTHSHTFHVPQAFGTLRLLKP